eukprot:Clim_evm27s197 gene=Clim_evmTU27s197
MPPNAKRVRRDSDGSRDYSTPSPTHILFREKSGAPYCHFHSSRRSIDSRNSRRYLTRSYVIVTPATDRKAEESIICLRDVRDVANYASWVMREPSQIYPSSKVSVCLDTNTDDLNDYVDDKHFITHVCIDGQTNIGLRGAFKRAIDDIPDGQTATKRPKH